MKRRNMISTKLKCRTAGRFARDRRGISSVEFAIVCSVFFMIVLGIIDFSRALWEWNMAAKATEAGVRYAVVNDMTSLSLRNFDCTGIAPIGTPAPISAVTPNPTICTENGCGASISTVDGNDIDAIAFQNIVAEMRNYYDRISASNVVIEYNHIGMGMCGNPLGPDIDPLITVRLIGMEFEFLTPGLAQLASPIDLPPFVATLSGEDGKNT